MHVSKLYKLLIFMALSTFASCGSTRKAVDKTPWEMKEDEAVLDSAGVGQDEIDKGPDSLDLVYPYDPKEQYEIAFLLPLFLHEYPGISERNKYLAAWSMDFWLGARLAFDTLRSIGFNANVGLIDTRGDTAELARQLKTLTDADLLMGPLTPDHIRLVAPFVQAHKINMVSPLATFEGLNGLNDRIFLSKPPVHVLSRAAAELITSKYGNDYSVVIYCRSVAYELEEAKGILALLPQDVAAKARIQEIEGSYVERGALSGSLPDSAVVLICSDKEPFVTSVLAELRRTLDPHKVVGRESWLEFQSLDVSAWQKLDMHIIATGYVDYTDTLLQSFVAHYRQKYHAEPSRYAISGFVETIYYCLYLNNYGANFQAKLNQLELSLPFESLHLAQDPSNLVFYNDHVKILKLVNDQLIEIK
jgi:hypothetical protein